MISISQTTNQSLQGLKNANMFAEQQMQAAQKAKSLQKSRNANFNQIKQQQQTNKQNALNFFANKFADALNTGVNMVRGIAAAKSDKVQPEASATETAEKGMKINYFKFFKK